MATTTAPPEPAAPSELAAPPLRQRLLSGSTLGPLAALIIACVFFSLRTDRFLTGGNFSLIIQQVMVVGTLAIGQTLIILTAGIDLSNGAIMAFASIVMTRLAGTATGRVLVGVYAIAGLVYGIAALLSVARTGVGDPQAGQTDNLGSITAVVIGGTSLFGGRGSVVGTLIGALIVGVIRNGLQLIGVASIYQTLITGILVILAVTVDQVSRRRTR